MKVNTLWAVIASLALNGCALECTLIGCDDGLTIEPPSGISGAVTVTLSSEDSGTKVQSCAAGCPLIFVPDYTPQRVRVKLEWASGQIEREFTPQYVTSQPNGPDCGPTCTQATLKFD